MDNTLFTFWQEHSSAPYHFPMTQDIWLSSWEMDMDSDGRTLFTDLRTKTHHNQTGVLQGLIQYGRTAFGFAPSGGISGEVHYNVIRALCFDDMDTGSKLLQLAMKDFSAGERVYAFFHYFGMTACARHGKLHESNVHIHKLLLDSGFEVEHENVYYSRTLTEDDSPVKDIHLRWQKLSGGGCREFAARCGSQEFCWGQVHFLPQGDIAYLRWIFVDEKLQHRGFGRLVMQALFADLYAQGIRRFDTDTASSNTFAQQFYEKTGFHNCGITRSYYTDS